MLLREQSKFQGSIYRVSSERERESERAPALDHRRRQKRSGREEDGGGRRPERRLCPQRPGGAGPRRSSGPT